MKRSGPLRRTPLRRGSTRLQRKAPLRAVSPRATERRTADADWSRLILERAGHRCQFPNCTNPATDAHHIAPKSIAPHLRHAPNNGAALCRHHHDWVHNHPMKARALGLYRTAPHEGPPAA